MTTTDSKDPLDLLRQFLSVDGGVRADQQKRIIQFKNGVVLPWTQVTRMKSKTGHYTVASAYFLWKTLKIDKEQIGEYMKKCKNELKIQQPVGVLDRRTLFSYLEGKIQSHPKIDPRRRDGIDGEGASALKDSRDASAADVSDKSRNIDDRMDVDDSLSESDKVLAKVFANEIVMNNRCTVMLGSYDFKYLLKLAYDAFEGVEEKKKRKLSTRERLEAAKKDRRKERERSSSNAKGASSGSQSVKRLKSRRGYNKKPIIVVPPGLTAVINLYNARRFLGDDAAFVSSVDMRKQGSRKDKNLVLRRTFSDGKVYSFRVVDMVNNLSTKELESIAVVLVDGKEYQFKGWRLGSTARIFARTKGIHFKFDNQTTPETVKKWKVDVLRVNKNKRHLDRTTHDHFWELVERFLVRKRPDIGGE